MFFYPKKCQKEAVFDNAQVQAHTQTKSHACAHARDHAHTHVRARTHAHSRTHPHALYLMASVLFHDISNTLTHIFTTVMYRSRFFSTF